MNDDPAPASPPSSTAGATPERTGRSEPIAPERCLDLLKTTTVGRVAFDSPAGIVLLPLNFRVIGSRLFVRVSAHGVLSELAALDTEVVFEADYHALTERRGWSVVVRGSTAAASSADLDELEKARPLVSWAGGARDLIIVLTPREVSGRHVHHH